MPTFPPLPHLVGRGLSRLNRVAPGWTGRTLLRLFMRPRAGKLSPADKVFLATADEQRNVDFNGLAIRTYGWHPQGKRTVLLLHGWESNAARWADLIAVLPAADLHVVAIDGPAHGASGGKLFNAVDYAACLANVLQHYPTAAVVGHSLGGMALAYYLYNHPETQVRRAVLLGVPSELPHMMRVYQDMLRFDEASLVSLERAIQRRFHQSSASFSVRAFCPHIHVPTLVIADRADQLAPLADSVAYAEELPDSQLLLTDGLGHSLQGEPVFRAIRDWLLN